MDNELQKLRKQVKELTDLFHLQSQRAMDYAGMAMRKREWQGLTENEIKHLWYEACQTNLELTSQLIVHLARNIEAKLKEKNT